MTQSELISYFPKEYSITDRVLLIPPSIIQQMLNVSVRECRVFILISEGNVTIKTGSSEYLIKANSMVDMLVWEPITFIRLSDNLRGWCLLPNYMFTNEALNGLKPADSESFKNRYEIPIMTLEDTEIKILERELGRLGESLADFNNYYRTELCQTYFRSFMLEAGNLVQHKKTAQEEIESVESRKDTIVRSFLKLVWRYYRSEHNVEFYARRLCLSTKHLSRVVKDSLGKTPHAVIRDEIIQQASELLKTSKKTIQEISGELHFSETPSFCKFFKKHTGMSPSVYRSRKTHSSS